MCRFFRNGFVRQIFTANPISCGAGCHRQLLQPVLVEPALHQIDAARAKGLAALAGGDGQPDVGVPPSRMLEKVRQRQMEDRLMVQTRTYLHNQEPARVASAAPAGKAESGIEILARAIDGGSCQSKTSGSSLQSPRSYRLPVCHPDSL